MIDVILAYLALAAIFALFGWLIYVSVRNTPRDPFE
jgi:hypothetical protein